MLNRRINCKKIICTVSMAIFGLLTLTCGSALAASGYLNSFNSQYGTAGSALDNCNLCHTSVPSLNGYGTDYAAGHNFSSIEGLDSDGDGFVNLDEINGGALPGDSASVPAAVGPVCTDFDADGFAKEGGACGPVDCMDRQANVNPNAQEDCTNGIDDNCDGLIDNADPTAVNCPAVCTDLDLDGYAIEGGNCGPVDCNDNNPQVFPGAAEVCTDNLDNDCDTLVDALDPDAVNCSGTTPPQPTCTDADADGYAAEGGNCGLADCDDTDPLVNPTAAEDCVDGIDNNCDGLIDSSDPNAQNCPAGCTDADFDGFAVEGGACGPVDCNDADEFINPAAAEECADGLDNNCNDLIDTEDPNVVNCATNCTDADGDGYAIEGGKCGPVDPDDSNVSVIPDASAIAAGELTAKKLSQKKRLTMLMKKRDKRLQAGLDASGLTHKVKQARKRLAKIKAKIEALNGGTDPAPTPQPLDGAQLYANNCAACHGGLNNSNVSNTSTTKINTAITGNVGGMGYLNSLSNAELEAIAAALSGSSTPVPTPTPTPDPGPAPVTGDGALLYDNYCASCHGDLNRSEVGGKSAGSTREAINKDKGGMGFLSYLSDAELQDIADALSGVGDD